MAKCTCAWLHHLLKLLTSALLLCSDSSQQDGFMLRFICVFLSCDLPILHAATKIAIKRNMMIYWKIASSCSYRFTARTTKYVTFYAWTNRLTRFSTCNLPIHTIGWHHNWFTNLANGHMQKCMMSVIYLMWLLPIHIQLRLCVNNLLLTSAWQQA